ncbi:MAG TPA: UDP-N-acetylmuramoyl-tripeptide--D-alanyl-D-alanine ligase [Trebonia sp.]|nr:UDP-N-acetylmuramoyl-tripeptide--D-alanyl-D-alanine ligase [Trebonia sp.]
MIRLTRAEIAAITGGHLDAGTAADVAVTGPVVIDSRRVESAGLFAALPGERVDGHDFAPAAIAAGAAAVLASRPVPGVPAIVVPDVTAALAALAAAVLRRLPAATVIGITGSSGKTSTKDLTAQLAERLAPTVAPEGSFNNEIGLPLTVLRADHETRYLVLEMSARGPGHIAALCEIAPPKIGAVLNVGRAHAGEFGSLDGVAKAKGELPEALPADGVAILNADDPRVIAMATRTAARIVTFSASGGRPPQTLRADITAADIRLDELGRASFRLLMPGGIAPVALTVHGAHHVPNALAAAAIAAELGMDTPAIADALSQATARSKRRMELRERPDGVLVINDSYNANPESMRAAIDALAHITRDGRRGFAVLGHMAELGDIAKPSHEEAGRLAARARVAGLIAVGEEARSVIDGARAEPGWHGEALAVPDAETAVAVLRNQLRPGDVVLVKASKAAGLWEVADGLLAEVSR